MLLEFICNLVNDKKGVLGILKIYGNFRKRTPDEFYHLVQTQVIRTLKKHPTLFGCKKVFTGITKQKGIFTRKKYRKEVIDKSIQSNQENQSFFAMLGKKGTSMVQL